jgi:hypothetical protein
MSAGGISYSAIVNSGKITLPSVEAGLGSMNMLRDPPKSIHTSRNDRVGQTSSITEMIDESQNRACEAIKVYARGVNPSVSVSYNNHGNNGGQRSSGITVGGQTAAKLPYTIIRDGAFRPPVRRQENLLPLSRLPRAWTTAFSQPGFADFSKKMRVCGTPAETKEVQNRLTACVRPTAVYKIERPLTEPFEVKNVIQRKTNVSASSGVRTMDRTEQYVGNPTKEVVSQPFHAYAQANYTDSKNYVDNNSFDSERFIQDANNHAVLTNISSHRVDGNGHTELDTMPFLQDAAHSAVLSGVSDYRRDNPDTELDTVRYLQELNHHTVLSNASSTNHQTPIDEVLDLADLPVHMRTAKIAALAPMSGPERTGEFGDVHLDDVLSVQAVTNTADTATYKRAEYDNEILLERNRPQPSMVSNTTGRGTKADQQVSRDFALKQKISAGGFAPVPQIPSFDRMQNVQSQDSRKREMYQRAAQNMHGRFIQPAPY